MITAGTFSSSPPQAREAPGPKGDLGIGFLVNLRRETLQARSP